jgi:hypothetical protein
VCERSAAGCGNPLAKREILRRYFSLVENPEIELGINVNFHLTDTITRVTITPIPTHLHHGIPFKAVKKNGFLA